MGGGTHVRRNELQVEEVRHLKEKPARGGSTMGHPFGDPQRFDLWTAATANNYDRPSYCLNKRRKRFRKAAVKRKNGARSLDTNRRLQFLEKLLRVISRASPT